MFSFIISTRFNDLNSGLKSLDNKANVYKCFIDSLRFYKTTHRRPTSLIKVSVCSEVFADEVCDHFYTGFIISSTLNSGTDLGVYRVILINIVQAKTG